MEDNEDIQIEITNSSLPDRVVVGYPGEATVTIVDNDSEINVIIKYLNLMKLTFIITCVLYFKDCC